MGRKKKTEDERTCGTCRFGPEGQSDDCDECEDLDAWAPKSNYGTPTDALEELHDVECDGDCKISVNGGPAVPFPSKEAEEQVEEVVKNHLDAYGRVVNERKFGNGHILTEYADGKVSLDGNPPVSKDVMKTIMEGVKELGTETAKKVVGAVKQLDLEMKPAQVYVPEDEMETVTYRKFDLGKFMAKIRVDTIEGVSGDESLMRLCRSKVKVATKALVNDGDWDAACHALHKQLGRER